MCTETSRSRPQTGDRLFPVLWISFVLGMLIISWGRTAYYRGTVKIFSMGGNSGSIMFPLFFLYCCYRVYKKDTGAATFWKDPVVIFCVFALLSPLWSSLHDFGGVFGYLLPALLGYLMASYLLEKDYWGLRLPFLTLLCSSAALMVLRGFFELPFIPGSVAIMHSTAEHHTILAMIIVSAIPLSLGLLMEHAPNRILQVAALAVFLPGIFLVSSRIGWIAFFTIWLFYILKLKKAQAKVMIALVPVLSFCLLLAVFPQYGQRFFSLGHLGTDRETGTRFENWRMCGVLIGEHMILGLGFSNKEYKKAARIHNSHFQYEHPHNLFLHVTASLGILGLSLFGVVVWRILRAFTSWRGSRDAPLYVALQASYMAFLVMNMADSALNSHRASLFFFLLLSFLFTFSEKERARE